MVHHRQGLPLGLEAGQDLPRVHARLDDLQRHAAADRLLLVGKIDRAKTAFAQHAEQFVAGRRRELEHLRPRPARR